MSDALQQARIDMAAALRLAAKFGYSEGVCNHFSFALPGMEDRFLLNPHGVHWSMMKASGILVVDKEGNILDGEGEIEVTAFCIHSQVHEKNPRARCVRHTHMPYATALTSIEGGRLEPINQNSLRFYGDVAYDDDYNGLAGDLAEGERIASCIGDKRVVFLASHGVIVVGETIAEAFDDLYYLERAAEQQVLAMSTGRPLRKVGDNLARGTYAQFRRDAKQYGAAHFEALKRMLEKDDPSFLE